MAMGNAWTGVLRPELDELAHESILVAALIHTRCILSSSADPMARTRMTRLAV